MGGRTHGATEEELREDYRRYKGNPYIAAKLGKYSSVSTYINGWARYKLKVTTSVSSKKINENKRTYEFCMPPEAI